MTHGTREVEMHAHISRGWEGMVLGEERKRLNLVNLEMLIILGGLARVDILNEMAQEVDLTTRIVQQHARIIGQGAETVRRHHHCQIRRVHSGRTRHGIGGECLEKTQYMTQ